MLLDKNMLALDKIKKKKEQGATLFTELEDSLYLKRIFPSIVFPVTRVVDTEYSRAAVDAFHRVGGQKAVSCYLDDTAGVRHHLTLEQYNGLRGTKPSANAPMFKQATRVRTLRENNNVTR